MGVGPGHRTHRVEAHAKTLGEQRTDTIEVEEPGHQLEIVGDRIDDLDSGACQVGRAEPVERRSMGQHIARLVRDRRVREIEPGLYLATATP